MGIRYKKDCEQALSIIGMIGDTKRLPENFSGSLLVEYWRHGGLNLNQDKAASRRQYTRTARRANAVLVQI